MSDNLTLSKNERQTVLATAIRIAGADVTAGIVAGTGVEFDLPPNVIVLRCKLVTSVVDGGTSPTFNVGPTADEDGFGANLAVGAVAGVDGAGALLGELLAASTKCYVTEGTGTISNDGTHTLVLEYVQLDRSNEVYG